MASTTVSVSLPSLKPLKFKPLLSEVSPELSWNVAVLAVVSTVSHVESICGFAVEVCAAQTGAESRRTAARRLEHFVMRPSYLATGADRKAHVDVATGSGFVEAIARGVDDHRADIEMIERVVDSQKRGQSRAAGLSFPSHTHVRRPPRRGAGGQRIAHEIS